MKYTKPPLTFEKQVKLLIKRGLSITNHQKAEDILKDINYYHLSAYFLPFQNNKDRFLPGTTLEQIMCIYEFDRKLRLLFMSAIEFIEISMRTKISYFIAHRYGPFAYSEPKIFQKHFKHNKWMDKLSENLKHSREVFVKHFKMKYIKEKHLPIWIMIEIIALGQLSQLYNGLQKKDKQSISHKEYGVSAQVLTSWLHSLTYIRNMCAHHNRLWNRILAITPKLAKNMPSVKENKIFKILLLFKYMMLDKGKWEYFLKDLNCVITQHPNIRVKNMGFLDNWKEIL